jgi:cytochrome c oxidase subunit 4
MATSTGSSTAGRFEAKRPYIPVFAVLGILTLIEIQIPGFPLPKAEQVFLLVSLAVGKASLVALYYMHLRYEPRLLALVPVVPLILALALVVTVMA